jgi:NitT/TauT family transport system permease protein
MLRLTTRPEHRVDVAPAAGHRPPSVSDSAGRRTGWLWRAARAQLGSDWILSAGALLVGVVLWEVLGRMLDLLFLPPAGDVIVRCWELVVSGPALEELAGSLSNLAIGYVIAAVAGVAVGVAMARNRLVEQALDPYVYAFLTAPTIVFVPIYFAIFGLSHWAIVALIVQYAVFIIIVNTVTAVKTVDAELVEMARVFGARNELVIVRKVLLRAALPLISSGLRLGLGRSIKGMINGEILIAVVGLGGLSSSFGRAFDSEGVLAVLLIVIVVALVLDRVALYVDRRVNAWLPSNYR